MTYIPGMMKFKIVDKVTDAVINEICDDIDTIKTIVDMVKEIKNEFKKNN